MMVFSCVGEGILANISDLLKSSEVHNFSVLYSAGSCVWINLNTLL